MKKKALLVLVSLLAIVNTAFPFSYTYQGKTLYYNISNGQAVVTTNNSYTPYSGDIIIPSSVTYNGNTYSVTSIGNFAFDGCSGLTSITIPNSVTSIGSSAFDGCSGLTSITIPNSVTSIGYRAFDYCIQLTSITIPNSVNSIGNYAFRGCSSLTSVIFNADSCISAGSLNYPVFYGCSNLTNIIFGNNVRFIPSYLCYGRSSLTSVTIGSSATYIGNFAFEDCIGLTSITIPNSVTSIGKYAFYDCSGLTSATLGSGITLIDTAAFEGCSGLTSITIPNSVTSIGISAFSYCSGLTSVTIGSGVTSIGGGAFGYCFQLTSIAIPNSVTSIGDYAFSDCSGLNSVTIGSGVTSIGNYAFRDCSGLTSVIFNADSCVSAGSLNNPVFYGCSNLTNIFFGNNVRFIPSYLCYGRSGLTSATLGSGITLIDTAAFEGCSGLTSITIPNSVNSIGNYAFRGCSSLTSVIFNADSCISAGSSNYPVFYGCINLTNIIFGNNVRYIPSYLCYGRSGLTSVTIPNSVTSIGDYTFRDCSGLTTITIPNSVTSIGNYAFRGCSGLSTVYMMPVTPPTLGYEAFSSNASGRVFILTGCSYDDYYNASSWNTYRSALRGPIIDFIVNVQSSNSTRGTANFVLGQGNIVRCDSTVVVRATANSDYHFDHWSNGSIANPDTLFLTGDTTITAYFIGLIVTSSDPAHGSASHTKIGDHLEKITATTNSHYHFERWSTNSTANPDTITLTGDSTITAYFERNSYNLTVNVNDATLGSVATPQGSSALYQDTLMVVATPTAHYHVASWQGQGLVATSAHKDTAWVRMSANLTLTCNFAIDTHTVAVQVNDIARGMVEATGTQFAYGTPCTVTATAYTGYNFAGWSNGVTASPYTFAVLNDVELTAIFLAPDEITYTVTVESNDPTMGTATVNGNSTATVINGDSVTITATAFNGYRFVRWNDNDTHAVRTVTVTADATYTAFFESVTQGIADVDESEVNVYVTDGRIHVSVDGIPAEEFRVYELMGREVFHATHADGTSALPGGVYLVKVDALPARKVVVIR